LFCQHPIFASRRTITARPEKLAFTTWKHNDCAVIVPLSPACDIRGGGEADIEDGDDDNDDFVVDDDVEVEETTTDVVIDTIINVSKQASVIVGKASKVTAFWTRCFAVRLYRACKRAVYAGLEGDDDDNDELMMEKLLDDDDDEEESESSLHPAVKVCSKKAWMLSKRVYRTIKRMTIAFWSFDDEQPEQVGELEETETPAKASAISMFSRLKFSRKEPKDEIEEDEEKEDDDDDDEEETVVISVKATVVEKENNSDDNKETSSVIMKRATCVGGDSSSVDTAIVPKAIVRKRDIILSVFAGIASVVFWEQAGRQIVAHGAVIAKRKFVQFQQQSNSEDK
jgi:hypothetical protein